MADMIFLQCENGSKAVKVACSTCGRISLQILKTSYSGTVQAVLSSTHTCTVCGSVFHACSTVQTQSWSSAFSRYKTNPSAYNSAIKDNYSRQQIMRRPEPEQNLTALKDWENVFTDVIRKRGESYFRFGRVANLSRTESKCSATITGTQLYHTTIHLRNKQIVSMECSCPYAQNGENCKHMAALLYATEDSKRSSTSDTGRVFAPIAMPAVSANDSGTAEPVYEPFASVLQQHIENEKEKEESAESTPVAEKVGNSIDEQIHHNAAPNANQAQATGKPVKTNVPFRTSSSNVSSFEEAGSLEKKLNRWKKELLDTGKRNKMINYRETKRSTLRILEPSAEELFNKLAFSEKELKFQRPINKDSDSRTYSILALMETLSYNIPIYDGDIKADGTIVEREKR